MEVQPLLPSLDSRGQEEKKGSAGKSASLFSFASPFSFVFL
jgi:hypothetical protein